MHQSRKNSSSRNYKNKGREGSALAAIRRAYVCPGRALVGNRLEALKGDWRGFYSIRINDQWRLVFRWQGGHAAEVRVVDYH